ncbi:MAG: hypothetical protein M1812_001895 [Candelaria pacifica]|nr:MAG: hypothetical protein M1812_001895 [Candelaria pacifica]
MSSEARLYTFSTETKEKLRKFRLGTSRAKDPQAVIYQINKQTLEIGQDGDEVFSKVGDIADELPDHSPRYVLLSYPLTLVAYDLSSNISQGSLLTRLVCLQPSGRLSVPYALIYYLPVTCNAELRMLYAGAKELMRNTAEVGRVIEIDSAEDLEEIEAKLGGE